MRPLRREKVKEAIHEVVSNVLQRELKDPRIGFVTVTRVEMSPDGRHVKVFISVLGTEEQVESSMSGLKQAEGFIRSRVAQSLQMRYAPELLLVYDPSLAKSERVQQILKSLEDEDRKPDTGLDL